MCVIWRYGRFWVEGYGWATTDPDRATRYPRDEATKFAQTLHAEVMAG